MKHLLDRLLTASWIKQLLVLFSVFIALFLLWYGVSFLLPSNSGINKEIPSRHWSILAQMLDPGNQHMVADSIPSNSESTNASLKSKDTPSNSENINTTSETKDVSLGLRIFVLLVSFTGTIAFGGLLISTISNIFERRIEQIQQGLIPYSFKNHYVIIGFDSTTIGVVKQLLQKKNARILIQSSQSIPEMRAKLITAISREACKSITFMFGDRINANDLSKLSLEYAKEIFIIGEPENTEPDHDAKNMKCYYLIDTMLNKKPLSTKTCHVLFHSNTTFTAFQFLDYNPYKDKTEEEKASIYKNTYLKTCNFYENWAQKLWVFNNYTTPGKEEQDITYKPLDFEHIGVNSDVSVHLVLIGYNRMSSALLIEAARLCHFANHITHKTKISVIDSNAKQAEYDFANIYNSLYSAVDVSFINTETTEQAVKKGLYQYIPIELEFVQGNVHAPKTRDYISQIAQDSNKLVTIAVCFSNSDFALQTVMYLPNEVYYSNTNILVRQQSSYVLVNMLQDNKDISNKYNNLKAFGMTDDCMDIHTDLEAQCINHFYWNCDEKLENIHFNNSDISNEWNGINERDKWSNRYNAYSIPVKLRAIQHTTNSIKHYSFTESEIDLLARMEHSRWNTERLIAGFTLASQEVIDESMKTSQEAWNVYISVQKNNTDEQYKIFKRMHEAYVKPLKTTLFHSCIIPYESLSEYYKNIDRQLVASIPKIKQFVYDQPKTI